MIEMSPNWALQSVTIRWSFSPAPGISLIISKKGIHNTATSSFFFFFEERLIYVPKKDPARLSQIIMFQNQRKDRRGRLKILFNSTYNSNVTQTTEDRKNEKIWERKKVCSHLCYDTVAVEIVSTLLKRVFPSQFGLLLLSNWPVAHLIMPVGQTMLSFHWGCIHTYSWSL